MFPKIISIIAVIISIIILSDSVRIRDNNDTSVFLAISSQLSQLKAELDRLVERQDLQHLRNYARNCAEATIPNSKPSGIYEILIPSYSKNPFKVTCDATTHGGGWTVILNRIDGSENFYRDWNTYKMGFGDLDGEFFLGLDKLHALTAEHSQQLLVILEDFEGTVHNVTYERFGISGEEQQYGLNTLSQGIGTIGDSSHIIGA
ncbi:ficolin-1-like [Drosophila innubila]|uniref:ficolin-1-like n=1 Tax=Drosophila innubila TaxID=198719 RepID=UPI00148CED74|nr:ficolin-1-like [Drosophila innubila]